jgi:transposase-like protein
MDVELVARLHSEGRSAAEISAIVGCTIRSVTRWRGRTGNRVIDQVPAHPETDREVARRLLFEDGCSIAEAARTVGAAWRTVARWFPDAPRCDQDRVIELGRIGRQFAALERRRAA